MTPQAIRVILVPVDFGPASARAVAIAGRLARHLGAELRLLHAEAADAPAYFTHDQVAALAAQRRQLAAQAQAYLGRFGRQYTSAPFSTHLDTRPPAEAVLAAAEGADLVVMGTHGRRGARRWWLGSVAERVLRHLGRPLLIVHETHDDKVMLDRIDVFGETSGGREFVRAFAEGVAAPFAAAIVEHAAAPNPPASGDGATLSAVSMPTPADRHWFATIAEPLVRSGGGAVVFVPVPVVTTQSTPKPPRREP